VARRLPPLTPERLDDTQRALYDEIVTGPRRGQSLVGADGSLRGPFDLLLRAPAVGRPLQAVGAAIRYGAGLPDDLRELAILATAAAWQCRFEWETHVPIAVASGLPADGLTPLWEGDLPELDHPHAHLVVSVVHEALDTRTLSAARAAELVAGLGDAWAVELLMVIGYYSSLALLLNAFDVG
jgi:4-carboxymuconolactone decarboxylase